VPAVEPAFNDPPEALDDLPEVHFARRSGPASVPHTAGRSNRYAQEFIVAGVRLALRDSKTNNSIAGKPPHHPYNFNRTNTPSGIARMMSMISRQNQGR
jgi:hypothetical protein